MTTTSTTCDGEHPSGCSFRICYYQGLTFNPPYGTIVAVEIDQTGAKTMKKTLLAATAAIALTAFAPTAGAEMTAEEQWSHLRYLALCGYFADKSGLDKVNDDFVDAAVVYSRSIAIDLFHFGYHVGYAHSLGERLMADGTKPLALLAQYCLGEGQQS